MSDQTREDIRRTWLVAGAAGHPADGVRAHQIAELDTGTISVYLGDDGVRHLIIPAVEGEVYPRLDGSFLTVQSTVLTFDDSEASFLEVACSSPGLFDLFDELLVSVIETARTSNQPAADAARTVLRWRDLLRATRPLSHAMEMGLFAELWTLHAATEGSEFDPEIWRGPLREAKDIVADDVWVEVKAVTPDAATVRINGLDQLADVPNTKGFLVCVEIREDPDGSTTGALVDSLTGLCSEPKVFEDRLTLSGWDPTTPSPRRWATGDLLVAPAGAVPRLTPAELAEPVHLGITSVRYQIDLAVIRSMSLARPKAVIGQILSEDQL